MTGRAALHICFALISTSLYAQEEVKVIPVSVNTASYNEYGAVPFEKGIIFCSDRQAELISIYEDASGRNYQDIYYAEKKGEGIYNGRKPFNGNIKTEMNEGPVCFSKDGNTAFITRNLQGRKNKNQLGIFISTRTEQGWTEPAPLPFNNDSFSVCHANISPDGKTLFFASNDPKGFGGFDLYKSILTENIWSKPINLGKGVNSVANEVFPFYHITGMLYFSSQDSTDLDVFVSEGSDGNFSSRHRLSKPFNSTSDDLAFYLNEDGTGGYFSSNRAGSDDIYEFTYTFPALTNCDTLKPGSFCYDFFEKKEDWPKGLPLTYEWDLGDGTKKRGYQISHCYRTPGKYTVQLNVIDTITNEIALNEAAYILTIADEITDRFLLNDTCYSGLAYELKPDVKTISNKSILGYYWDAGPAGREKAETFKVSFNEPGQLYVKHGIEYKDSLTNSKRIKCICKPVVILNDPNKGLYASFREIPFKFIKSASPSELLLNDIRIRQKGPQWIVYNKNESIGNFSVSETSIVFGASFLDKKHEPKPEFGLLLNSVADMLIRLPDTKVTINAYTDDNGDELQNLRISQLRAMSVAEYLVFRGVRSDQITFQGYGVLNPVTSNTNEEGRIKNQRIEIVKR